MKRISNVLVAGAIVAVGASVAVAQSIQLTLAPMQPTVQPTLPRSLDGAGAEEASASGVYIVQLEDAPLATYGGAIPGLAATNPQMLGANHLELDSASCQAYDAYLQSRQAEFARRCDVALGRAVEPRFVYRHAFNGMALELNAEEAKLLAKVPGVVKVEREKQYQPTTDNGPGHIGAPRLWRGINGVPGSRGEGVVVAILDSGINSSHPSFADIGGDGYDHTNPLGSGNYIPGSHCDANPSFCNDKLIGAWDFVQSAQDPGAPEDDDGHGSHTAATVAGNVVRGATVVAPTTTFTQDVSGVAPHANIIAYDVCIDSCPGAALLAAVNQVVIDAAVLPNGIAALNYSISGGNVPYSDPVELAFLSATSAGVFVSASAGNAGPGPSTTGHNSPWVATVAAMTHKRNIANTLSGLSSDAAPLADIEGVGLTSGYGPAPIVYAGDYPTTGTGGENDTQPEQCLEPFPAGTWNGEIVVCDRGAIARTAKGANVLAGGAGGFVLANTDAQGESVTADAHFLPGVHIGASAGEVLRDWLANNPNTTATIDGYVTDISADNADIMAAFSSRGPNISIDVLKPDVGAPGVAVMAAVDNDPSTAAAEYGFLSGTSMSSPHNAGAGALISALTDWTPYEIRSALMMTAKRPGANFKEDGMTAADPFDVGAGRINLRRVLNVGLVMDETEANFRAADPALDGDPRTLNLASMMNRSCVGSCSFTRTVTNVTGGYAAWEVRTRAPTGVRMRVVTNPVFHMADGDSRTFTIDIDASTAPREWGFGEVILDPKSGVGERLRIPVAVRAADSTLPELLSHTVSNPTPSNGDTVTNTIEMTNGALSGPMTISGSVSTNMLVDDTSVNAVVTNGTTTSGFTYDRTTRTYSWSGSIDVGDIDLVASPSPFGFVPLASLGVQPFGCPDNCDDGSFNLNVPAFQYNGETYSSVIWSVNGTLEVGDASGVATTFNNQDLPNPAPPNNILAPFWTDLDMGSDGDGSEWYVAVLTAGARQFTVYEWNNIPLFGTTTADSNYSFQIWVENGTANIWYVYGALNGPVNVATVGAENEDGTVGTSYWFEGTGIAPAVGTDLQITTTPGGSVTLSFDAQAKNCPRRGRTIVSEVEMTHASDTHNAIAVMNCSR